MKTCLLQAKHQGDIYTLIFLPVQSCLPHSASKDGSHEMVIDFISQWELGSKRVRAFIAPLDHLTRSLNPHPAGPVPRHPQILLSKGSEGAFPHSLPHKISLLLPPLASTSSLSHSWNRTFLPPSSSTFTIDCISQTILPYPNHNTVTMASKRTYQAIQTITCTSQPYRKLT